MFPVSRNQSRGRKGHTMWLISLILGMAMGGSSFPESALFPGKPSQLQWEEVLLERLLDGYNDLVLPVENATQPVNVLFGLSLVQLLQIDEQNQACRK